MPRLLSNRADALKAMFSALPEELKHWEALSRPNGEFEKHHSQIAILTKQMNALNEQVETEWGTAAEFAKLMRAQQRAMAVQTVWNYFREKLLLRRDIHLGPSLKAADAYVWACYEPALKSHGAGQAGAAGGSSAMYAFPPPLVTFHSEISPTALGRQSRYETDADPSGVTRETAFERVRQALPVSILSVPWSLSKTLPYLALLAHEVGHLVETDFQLDGKVKESLRTALADSKLCDGWSEHWQREVFADLFACHVAGPSYVWAMIESLADTPELVGKKRRPTEDWEPNWGKYPPAGLRVRLNLKALELQGAVKEARAIAEIWESDYPDDAMEEFAADVEKVVRAVDLPPDWKYPAAEEENTLFAANNFLDKLQRYDARVLIAVAGQEGRKSTAAGMKDMWGRISTYMIEARPPGILGEPDAPSAPRKSLKTQELADLLFREIGAI